MAHVTVTTDDGSYGTKGYVSTVIDQMDQEFDAIYSCGAPGMLKYVNTKFHDHPAPTFLWNRVWLVGWVLAMPVWCIWKMKAKQPISAVCEDGPVFETGTIVM